MATYISILRGINVSGHKLIKMDVLKKMYENMGLEKIKTYVQSGNVIFSGRKTDTKKLANQISQQILNDFGFEVPVIVLTTEQLQTIIEQNPFLLDKEKEVNHLHVTFLSEPPKNIDLQEIEAKRQEKESVHFSSNCVYLYCPNGYGNTKLSNSFLENKLKITATTRNWKTTNELLKLALK